MMRIVDHEPGLWASDVDRKLTQCVFYLAILVQCQCASRHDDELWVRESYAAAAQGGHPSLPPSDSPLRHLELPGDSLDLTLPTTTPERMEASPELIVSFWQTYGPVPMKLRARGDVLYNFLHDAYCREINLLERKLGRP